MLNMLLREIKRVSSLPGRTSGMEISSPEDFIHDDGTKDEVDEATKLSAPSREIGDDELSSYLDRVRSKEKTKQDKFKYPYIHRSHAIEYYDEAGGKYDIGALKKAISQRPKTLLKKNEKMQHSDGSKEQFFNIGLAALKSLAVNEETNKLIVVSTCPGAGVCKTYCFAKKGMYIIMKGPWMSASKVLTYLLNDPDGFYNHLDREITNKENSGTRGDYKVGIRWHDSGDFFSPEYTALAFRLARAHPNVNFFAYTKTADTMGDSAPKNFILNWSEGAKRGEENKVKAKDPELKKTKHSVTVPREVFSDLLKQNKKINGNDKSKWDAKILRELKHRLAAKYGYAENTILSYPELINTIPANRTNKWKVIVRNGVDGDISATRSDVLATLLLIH